jgi:hypothetical protein
MQNKSNITTDWLTLNRFKLVETNPFEDIPLPYYVRNSVILFFNPPLGEYNTSFLLGYGEMRQGKYKAVTFRWTDKKETIVNIFEAITGEKF